jgi:undecaprenyl-diphosphatase
MCTTAPRGAQVALFVLGTLVLAGVSFAAHSLAYFPGDIAITHAVQAYHSEGLETALGAVGWLGFPPQSQVLFGAIVVLLFVFGLRWAAVAETIAAVGSGGLYLGLERVVQQPRPSAELVQVLGSIQMTGFPSGHMATFTAVFGFLAFLAYRHFGASTNRWIPVVLVVILLVLVGIARIYAGHHWASAVVAGALLGALWLGVVVSLFYQLPGERKRAQRPGASA